MGWLCAAALLMAEAAAPQAVPPRDGELIERTLALVGGQVIALSDVRAADLFGLVDVGEAADRVEAITTRLIERELVLREVRRYAPPEPAEAAIDERLATVRRRFADAAAFAQALEATGFTERRVRRWIRDDLRVEAYLAQRFATAGQPTDQEVAEAWQQSRAEFERAGLTVDAATPVLRARLAEARRRELIADWVNDLRRRTPITVFRP
jgi:transposase InsO family protein